MDGIQGKRLLFFWGGEVLKDRQRAILFSFFPNTENWPYLLGLQHLTPPQPRKQFLIYFT